LRVGLTAVKLLGCLGYTALSKRIPGRVQVAIEKRGVEMETFLGWWTYLSRFFFAHVKKKKRGLRTKRQIVKGEGMTGVLISMEEEG